MQIQSVVNEGIQQVRPIVKEHGDIDKFEQIVREHQQFKVRLPLIGAFSVGKSSLINKLLDENLLSVEINPETSLPAEISYSPQETIRLMNNKGEAKSLTREALKAQQFVITNQNASYWVEVMLPSLQLSRFPQIAIVDMPGWESGIAQHSQAIDNYIHRSGAYMVVVSAEDGEIKDSIKRILLELKVYQKPVVLVITKSEKRLPEDLPNIKAKMIQSIRNILGVEPIYTAVTAARKRNIDEFIQAIDFIYQHSDSIYSDMVGKPLVFLLQEIVNRLDILLNSDNLTIEDAKNKCNEVVQEISDVKKQLTDMNQQIDGIVSTCSSRIKESFRSQLMAEMPAMTSAVLYNDDISDIVGSVLRQAFSKGIEYDFKPKISRQLESLSHDLLPDIGDVSTNFQYGSSEESGGSILSSSIPIILANILSFIPLLKPFMPIVSSFFALFKSDADKHEQEEQRRNKARSYISNTIIPQVLQQSQSTIQDSVSQLAEKVKQEIQSEIDQKAAAKMQALEDLQMTLQQNEAEHKKQIQLYRQQRETLLHVLNQVKG